MIKLLLMRTDLNHDNSINLERAHSLIHEALMLGVPSGIGAESIMGQSAVRYLGYLGTVLEQEGFHPDIDHDESSLDIMASNETHLHAAREHEQLTHFLIGQVSSGVNVGRANMLRVGLPQDSKLIVLLGIRSRSGVLHKNIR